MAGDLKQRMEGAITALKNDFNGLRTGRASADLLSPVKVEAYGQEMPLNQVANVSVSDARLITVQVWDKGMIQAVEKGIRDAGLGLNPATDGQTIRVPLPDLNEERRAELVKLARKYAEDARIAIRNVRRDGMDQLKRQHKAGELSEDELKGEEARIQKLTDDFTTQIDTILATKEKDIQRV